MERLLAVAPALLEEALAFACIRGHTPAAEWLVRHGARGDVLVAPGGTTPRTALHDAANRGHRQIVELLLASGADCTVAEPRGRHRGRLGRGGRARRAGGALAAR
jgi:Ankyrin repeats (3 copies)